MANDAWSFTQTPIFDGPSALRESKTTLNEKKNMIHCEKSMLTHLAGETCFCIHFLQGGIEF